MVEVVGEQPRPLQVLQPVGLQPDLRQGHHPLERAVLQRLDVAVRQRQRGHELQPLEGPAPVGGNFIKNNHGENE